MGPELIVTVLGAALSAIACKLVLNKFVEKLFGEETSNTVSYAERLEKLTSSLTKSSTEIDGLLNELSNVAKERQKAVDKVETELLGLQGREKELQQRIDQLKDVPLPVAEHLAKLMAPGEKRSARRDYVLFVSGVLVSTILAVLLRVLGLA